MTVIAARAAAMAVLILPFAALAQEASPSIAVTHAALIARDRPPNSARLPIAPVPTSSMLSLPNGSTAPVSDIAALGPMKVRSATAEWTGGEFKLTAMRARSLPATSAAQSFEYRHFGLLAIQLGAAQQISARDTLSLGATFAVERRRPAFIVSPHRNYRSDERAIALHWSRDNRFDFAASLFDAGPAKNRTPVERIADLAGGAPRAVRGWRLTASMHPAGDPERLSVGIDFRQQQDRDVQHRGARVQIFLRQKF